MPVHLRNSKRIVCTLALESTGGMHVEAVIPIVLEYADKSFFLVGSLIQSRWDT